jgi:hypothetical protein
MTARALVACDRPRLSCTGFTTPKRDNLGYRAHFERSASDYFLLGGLINLPNLSAGDSGTPSAVSKNLMSAGGGAGGGGGPSYRFLSIQSQTHSGSHPFRSDISSFTIKMESDAPIIGLRVNTKSLAGRAVHTIQQLYEYRSQSGANALNAGSSSCTLGRPSLNVKAICRNLFIANRPLIEAATQGLTVLDFAGLAPLLHLVELQCL